MAIELDGEGFEWTVDQTPGAGPDPILVAQANDAPAAPPASLTVEISDGSILRLPEGPALTSHG